MTLNPLASYCHPERGLNIWLAYCPLASYCHPERGLIIWLAYRPLASYCDPEMGTAIAARLNSIMNIGRYTKANQKL